MTITTATVAPEYVGNRPEDLGLAAHLNLDQLDEIASRLNESKDFSDRNIHAVADEIHVRAHGFTASQARDADQALQTLRDAGHPDQAEALLTVTEARLANARRAVREEFTDQSVPATAQAPSRAVPDGKKVAVPADDPRVQAGQVFDKIDINGQTFHRRREGVLPTPRTRCGSSSTGRCGTPRSGSSPA